MKLCMLNCLMHFQMSLGRCLSKKRLVSGDLIVCRCHPSGESEGIERVQSLYPNLKKNTYSRIRVS